MFYEDDSKSRRLDWELTSRPRLSSSLQPARSQTYAGSIGALFKSEEFSTELIIHLAALFREAQIHSYISWQAAETAALLKKSSYTFSHKCGFFFFFLATEVSQSFGSVDIFVLRQQALSQRKSSLMTQFMSQFHRISFPVPSRGVKLHSRGFPKDLVCLNKPGSTGMYKTKINSV